MGAEMGCKIKWQYIVFNYNEKHIGLEEWQSNTNIWSLERCTL